MLIIVPVWFNSFLLIYFSYDPWKSLKSTWIWFWPMGKNHVNSFLILHYDSVVITAIKYKAMALSGELL